MTTAASIYSVEFVGTPKGLLTAHSYRHKHEAERLSTRHNDRKCVKRRGTQA
jgi:hypothetical protein